MIVHHSDTFSLIYAIGNCELDRMEAVVEVQGLLPNGYTWSGILQEVLRDAGIDMQQIRDASEGGMVALVSASDALLRRCAEIITQAIEHPDQIAQIAQNLPPD